MKRRISLTALAVISVGLLSAAWFHRLYWMVFVLPCISLILLQLIALSGWRRKENLFKYTDYVYYILIGVIVGLGSRYFDQRKLIAKFEQSVEIATLEQKLKGLDGELSGLRDMLKSAKPPVEKDKKMDRNMVAACTYWETMRREGMTQRLGGPRLSAEYCDEYFSRFVDAPAALTNHIARVEREGEETRRHLSSIRGHERNGERSLSTADPRTPEVMFLWFPTLLLLGVTLKLGKTTCALFPLSQNGNKGLTLPSSGPPSAAAEVTR